MAATEIVSTENGAVRFEHMCVTPDLAREWLARLPLRQRRIMPAHARALADEMRAERWNDHAVAPIQLARDGGWVLDGRHRLQGIVDTGRSQWFYVASDVDPDTFEIIDAIRPRSAANVLEAEGFKNATELEAVARLLHSWVRGGAEFEAKPPRSRVLDLARAYGEALQPLFSIAEKAARQTRVTIDKGQRSINPMPRSIATFCAFLESDTDNGLIGRLADWPEEALDNHVTDAVALFRTALMKRVAGGRSANKRAAISLFVIAKNIDYTGAPLPAKLVFKSSEQFPVPEWPVNPNWASDRAKDSDDEE